MRQEKENKLSLKSAINQENSLWDQCQIAIKNRQDKGSSNCYGVS